MKEIKRFQAFHNEEIDESFHQLNLDNIGHVVSWAKLIEKAKDVEGCIVECGIGRGRSLLILSALNFLMCKSEGGQRDIYGFDSFEGFPEPKAVDESLRNPKKGEWSTSPSGKYKYSEDFVKQILLLGGIPKSKEFNINLTKGFFDKSLTEYSGGGIAILHVDCDLYQSYKDVLENLFKFVVPGGIVVFDDIFPFESEANSYFPGAWIAVKEFFKEEWDNFSVNDAGIYYYAKK